MLHLRPYENRDAQIIAIWMKDEVALRKWSADWYERYPVSAEDINHLYAGFAQDTFFPMTAFDDSGVVGHFIMRFPVETRSSLRFGFVIVDDSKRAMGYGKQMLALAIQYAVSMFHVQKIALCVFESNPQAYHCYRAVGFRDVPTDAPEYYPIMGENWKRLEMALEP